MEADNMETMKALKELYNKKGNLLPSFVLLKASEDGVISIDERVNLVRWLYQLPDRQFYDLSTWWHS